MVLLIWLLPKGILKPYLRYFIASLDIYQIWLLLVKWLGTSNKVLEVAGEDCDISHDDLTLRHNKIIDAHNRVQFVFNYSISKSLLLNFISCGRKVR